MKQINNKLIGFFIICFLFMQISIAQTYSEDEGEAETITQNNVSAEVFSSFFKTTEASSQTAAVQGNSVFLQQVGQSNNTKIRVASENSDINVLQNGNFNQVDLTYQVKSVITTLQQNGDNNSITDYSIDPNQDITLDLQQNGSNLNFERFGTNELSKKIKFTQTTASPTIIIRSFK